MKVVVSAIARQDLVAIWQWNAKDRGVRHADHYLDFLESSISDLSDNYTEGKTVPTRHAWLYLLLRRRSRGHGHVVVYTVVGDEVRVLHIFHTAQDWQTKVAKGP